MSCKEQETIFSSQQLKSEGSVSNQDLKFRFPIPNNDYKDCGCPDAGRWKGYRESANVS